MVMMMEESLEQRMGGGGVGVGGEHFGGGEVGVMGEDGDVVCCCLWGRLCTSLAQCRPRVEPWAHTL